MMKRTLKWGGFAGLLLLAAHLSMAQRWRRGGGWGEGYIPNADTIKTAREAPSHSTGTPNWTNAPGFEKDSFTFTRVRYSRGPGSSWSAGNWQTDFPDSDLNLSFRLQQMTSIKVDPDGRVINLMDKELYDYPWLYMVEPGRLYFEEEEVTILRNYLLNGGFLMADDFWGESQWENFAEQFKRVFPERSFIDLPMEHPVFHSVFELKGPKNNLQVPNVRTGAMTQYGEPPWEIHEGEECSEVHIRAILDDKGRIMVIGCHNTDNGDGWEREGENDYYFHRFSENISFPLGINIIFYAMTH